ncbi:MAG: outer membrane homotrimeric porin [Desulfovibrio sp.]|nr:outer membrane homotrimeric porin [Desulfovibrio sp.]
MQRVWTLALAGIFALGLVGAARAVEVQFSGDWDFAFGWADNADFADHDGEDDFMARQRFRTQAVFAVSEDLRGVLMFEIGTLEWGRDSSGNNNVGRGAGGSIDTDGVNVETKLAYVDWAVPSTDVSVRMGLQHLVLPDAVGRGNPVLNSDVAALAVTFPFSGRVGLTAVWARPFDAGSEDGDDRNLADEMDLFALILPVTGDGWTFTPWGAYARLGAASGFFDYVAGLSGANSAFFEDISFSGGDASNVWWGGLAFGLTALDPFSLGLNVIYGHADGTDITISGRNSQGNAFSEDVDFRTAGWLLAATLDYKLDWGSVGLFGWYSTGDDAGDAQDGEYGRLPAIGFDNGFAPTSMGGPGSYSIGTDTVFSATFLGTWGIGVQLADWSFVEDLSHTLRLTYYRGTNEHEVVEDDHALAFSGEAVYLTDKDQAFEINFNHLYKIYDNLNLILEMSYIHLDQDEDIWGDDEDADAWKAQMLLNYSF